MRKVAFLVASDECPEDPEIPKLLFPKSDAETLSEILADSETCGFEPHVHINEPSYKVLEELYDICSKLKADDTLLFYYSGHGMRRGNELCLVSRNTKLARLLPTSIKATEVLGYLRDSYAKRRILVLDCCYSGVIGLQYKAADTDSSLDALGNDFGTCILTASTSIELSEEREKDGHGLFTKALIDCLREPPKERINVDDWYLYAVDRLKISGSQKPTKCGYVEGRPIEIGDFRQRFARTRQQELEQLISTARDKLQPYVAVRVLTEARVESIIRSLKCDEAELFPHERRFRERVIRFLKGEITDFLEAFATPAQQSEQPPKPQTVPDPPHADGWTKVDASICHGAADGWFKPGAGKLEWFKDHELGPEMVVVPAGEFMMGSSESEIAALKKEDGQYGYDWEGPQHLVTIKAPFAVSRFAITFDEWDACVADGGCNGFRPSDQGWGRGRRPVINVSFDDAIAYVEWLSQKTGKPYRLLSEAEREYVTRAGTTTAFWWGDTISTSQANYDGNFTFHGGDKGEYRKKTVPADSFEPNPWGLYNVHGNVWEWCEDIWHGNYNGAPTDGSAWVRGGGTSGRVVRCGSWYDNPQDVRAAHRIRGTAVIRNVNLGFRVARGLYLFTSGAQGA